MPYRASGILLHPTSFPSPFGIGDLGQEAYNFIDWLAKSGQKLWQVLPLGPTGFGNSPYMSYSSMAGNPLLISPEKLRENGLLTKEDLANPPKFPEESVDFERVTIYKMELLGKAYENFQSKPPDEFKEFCQQKAEWLNDYALFMAVRKANRGQVWNNWKPALAKHETEAIQACELILDAEINFQKYLQFEFFRQWKALKQYANERGIEIIGDIPIYVSHDSSDVWSYPKAFCIHPRTGNPTLIAGVPPDYFSSTGQLWGNPVYNWFQLKRENYQWWVKRFQGLLDLVDWIRIDHFRGFESFWAVKYGLPTAEKGKWIPGPGADFFEVIEKQLGSLKIIAEDLGVITPEVEALRDRFNFPGMKILQFAFGSGAGNPYLPHNYPRNCVVYTGTHDNDTTVGWFNRLSESEKNTIRNYLGGMASEEINWAFIRLALFSVADWAIIPLQDILGLGSEARMNTPGCPEGNWAWRYKPGALTDDLSLRLLTLTGTYGRCN